MATEKRLILADVTVDAFTKWLTSTYDGRMPADIVNEIPTVEGVEVVRCGECRLADTWKCPMSGTPGRVSASDFCSYGTKKMDGDGNA